MSDTRNEVTDYVIAMIAGGSLAGGIMKAFIFGIAGAIGGLVAKALISIIRTWWQNRKKK